LLDVEKAIDRDLKPRGAALTGWKADVQTAVKREVVTVKNVIGVVEGAGPLANEIVVVGAHYDHLGYGGRGSRAAKPGNKEIHHGADDNASGTTTMMELGRRFAKMKDRQGRKLVFMAFSAEESGLLGSRHYCNKEPLFPLEKTVAMINLDMVGRMEADPKTKVEKLRVEGVGTAKGFEQLIDKLNPGFQLVKNKGGTGPSDHDSFYRKKIPVIFYWTGTHSDYHKPSDTSDKINIVGMRKIADLSEKTIAHLAAEPKRPEYVLVASTASGPAPKGPRLGIVPGYEENKEGLMVDGVQDGGPAATAGIKKGDLIVEIAGKQVKNINTYMVLMAEQRVGQAFEVAVMRDGQKVKLKVELK
jgi:Zn-dependent M28 family amino/carboxypeptidase